MSDDSDTEDEGSTTSQDANAEVQVVEVEVDDDDDNEDTDDDDDEEQVEEVKTPPKNNKKSPSNTKKNPTPSTPKQSTTPGSATKKTPGSAPKNKVSYIQMVHDAIIAMKDRTGSSQIAILKYILAHNPDIDNPRLKQRLLLTLKAGVSSNRLQKIKASYKINPAFTKKNKIAKAKLKAKAKVKAKQPPKVKKISKAELAALKEKQEKERKEKERQERIRKRKFPMDDMDLIQEDKELGVHISLPSRPSLPLVMPAFSTACKSDTNLQGLLEDVLHVYHFFRGDVGWGLLASKSNSNSKQAAPLVVAPFTLSHWIHAVQQVLNGNAKKSRMVPPLFSHLFCVVLQHLLVQVDIPKLTVGLASSSWSEILLLYMDAMERYHTTEASKMESVLPPNPIDVEYLLGATDEPKEDWNVDETNTQGPSYLTGVMVKAHAKLLLQDPWLLSAEELLALLRALCDDLLANSPVMEEELDVRLVEVHELLKKKRAADARFRKLQTTMNREAAEEAKQEKSDDGPVRPTRSSATLKTITTAQLETAKKQQQRANDVYDKAVRTRQVRTESVGEDRQFHAAYHFANDPSLILVQQRGGLAKPTENWNVPIDFRTYKTSWHAIDKKSLLDSYLDSLDVRGKREGVLHEALTPVRRFLHDDIKELADRKARLREKKDLIRQLENAKIKAEVGRKSGRLAGRTEEELTALQQEIDDLAGTMEGKVEAPINYEYETGLIMLRQFDSDGAGGSRRRATRRDTKQQQEEQQEETLPKMPCSKLVSTGNIDGTGVVGVIVADMLELEERAQVLCDWEKKDRKAWVAALETLVHSWHIASPPVLESESTTPESPKEDTSRMSIGSAVGSDAKRKKVEDAPSTVPQTLSNLRQPLLELEERLFEMTGLAMAARDADEADENMSASEDKEEARQELIQLAWKKIVNRLFRIPAKAHVKIRQVVVEAIAAARKAQQPHVVAELRSALLQFHPEAAGACKTATLEILERHGGYDDADDEDDDDEEEIEEEDAPKEEDRPEEGVSSQLCAEAVILNSSLDGQEDASRADWIDAVKRCKTISKFASLAAAFVRKATEKLEKLETENDKLSDILEVWERAVAGKRKKTDIKEPSEVWANVQFTDDFCLAKVEEYPWWPAKKCVAKDENLAASLESLDRALVSFVGESGGIRVVKKEGLLPFSETLPEEETSAARPKELRTQLDDCMTMARRIIRGKEKKAAKAAKKKKKSVVCDVEGMEEKKLST